ncbi:formyl-CoA:oxalate CoA-transferase [Echria macrotheca]|uniref:Formyl-CoA:oxalate CoA-transferase n=1 Tax=Echria macrotheca TaxID=438768 RepID=A0AAJ0F6Y3_9PEZI|nr:formyl-CoA:oxalate CoA-transferase [Echria macrotheca]
MAIDRTPVAPPPPGPYSVARGALQALQALIQSCGLNIPEDFLRHVEYIAFTATNPGSDGVHFPTPLKEQDAMLAIKALEACAAAAIADLRYGGDGRRIAVDVDKTSCFLMSAYLTSIDGMGKQHPGVKQKIPDTDLNQAQSILYRRLSANLYETKNPGEYYHIHGSLEATKTLEMIGLPPFNPAMTDYRTCINTIEKVVKKFTSKELDLMNVQNGQAGIPALQWGQFLKTSHGNTLKQMPPLTANEADYKTPKDRTPPVPFDSSKGPSASGYALRGIKVLELCRVIAGPTIGRSLAAHGATVLKVTSPNLPDVPFFQVDVNTGKHTTALDLRDASDRQAFEKLLEDADVLIDGYRPGALARLGYSQSTLLDIARRRRRGFVYVAEDCFGGSTGTGTTRVPGAEWAGRPGWQQIADCVTGVAWAQGKFMGLDEPVVPPFPMSDYGTGALGCVAAMIGLYNRATQGGSWICRTSLCQYDIFLMGLGPLPQGEQRRLRKVHDAGFFDLRHSDSVDEVGRRALQSLRRVVPHLFRRELMQKAWSTGFDGVLAWPKEAIEVEGLKVGHLRASRPNGFDRPSWEGWEVDERLRDAEN